MISNSVWEPPPTIVDRYGGHNGRAELFVQPLGIGVKFPFLIRQERAWGKGFNRFYGPVPVQKG